MGIYVYNGDNQKAIDHADWVIRSTQNTSLVKDKAALQREGIIGPLITLYYSQYGSKYNLFREETHRAKRDGMVGWPRMAAFLFMMFVVEQGLNALLKGRGPDDDDARSQGKFIVEGAVSNFAAMFPPFGAAINSGMVFGGRSYRASPAFGVFESMARTTARAYRELGKAWDGEWDKVDIWRDLESTGETAGYLFGVPTRQLFDWTRAFIRWSDDEPDFSYGEIVWPKKR
ncbi:hypothetical protein FACS1894187_25550 [Synergistales bacterium]|nr:hypothetical protein FACS1894187_25550 [Synergistales bacterium]